MSSPRKGSKVLPRSGTPLRSPPKGKLFGAPLGADAPSIIPQALAHLREKGMCCKVVRSCLFLHLGLNEEGLFRLSGDADEVAALRARWDAGALLHSIKCSKVFTSL